MKKKTMYIVLLALIVLNVVCLFVLSGKVASRKDLSIEENKAKSALKIAKEKEKSNKKDVEDQLLKQKLDDLDPKVQKIAVFNSEVALLNTISENFFKDYFTWNNSEEYQNRKEVMSSYVSQKLIDDKSVFDEGLDNTGGNYVEATGIKSKFNKSKGYVKSDSQRNGELIEGLIEVEYESWFDNSNQKSISSKIYNFSFNKKDNKVESISLLLDYK